MSISHVLLGVLAEGPAHGYDLKREHDARFPAAKPLPYGQVYAALQRLERDELVEVAGTTQEAGPERTAYAITEAGREDLDSWLGQTEPAGPYAADELVRKTVTALNLGADAADFLDRQRAVHLARMKTLLQVQAAAATTAEQIAADHTITHLDADLKWLEVAAQRVAGERKASR